VHGRHRSEIGVVEGGGDMGEEEVENDGVGGPTPLCCFPSSSEGTTDGKHIRLIVQNPGLLSRLWTLLIRPDLE
jgi:hypothetical protein